MEASRNYRDNGKNGVAGQRSAATSSHRQSSVFMKYFRPCFAEFLVVLIFVFIGVCSVANVPSFIPLVHGLAIIVLAFLAGGISGAHINPAVTLGVLLAGAISPLLALGYVLSQLLGAIVGAGFARVVLTKVVYESINGGSHSLGMDVKVGSALLAEILATSVLVLTVQMTAVDSKNKVPVAPIPIGFAVAIGIYGIGSVSGGSLNPARSFGPALIGSYWSDHYVYWVGPIFGAVLASAIYRIILASPNRLLFCKGSEVQQSNTDIELGSAAQLP